MKALDPKPNHGEIWWVNFEPSTGHEYQGRRPALVVQAVELESSRLITIIPITTKVDKGDICDISIPKDGANGLYQDSLAKIQFIQSFDRSRFEYRIGKVNGDTMRQVDVSLRVHLGLDG